MFAIRTSDKKWWVEIGGNSLTKNRNHREIYDFKELAEWYIKGTNVWGPLKIVKIQKRFDPL